MKLKGRSTVSGERLQEHLRDVVSCHCCPFVCLHALADLLQAFGIHVFTDMVIILKISQLIRNCE